jgi:hypothetical protein
MHTLIETIDKTIEHFKGTTKMKNNETFLGFSVVALDHRFGESTRDPSPRSSAPALAEVACIGSAECCAPVSTISYPYFRTMDRRLDNLDTGLDNGYKTSNLDSSPPDSMA